MYSTHKEGKSIVTQRFTRTLKGKVYKKSYLNKLVNQCNNTYHRSIGKKPIDADYSTLT